MSQIKQKWDPTTVLGVSPLQIEERAQDNEFQKVNFASAFVGARVLQVSSEESGAEAENVLFQAPELVWRSRQGPPQWFIIRIIPAGVFPSLGLGRDLCKSIGWIASGQSRPMEVIIHVSPDGQSWRELQTIKSSIKSYTLVDLDEPFNVSSEPFLRFEVKSTANGGPCRMQSLSCCGYQAKQYIHQDDNQSSSSNSDGSDATQISIEQISQRVAAVISSEARQLELFTKLDQNTKAVEKRSVQIESTEEVIVSPLKKEDTLPRTVPRKSIPISPRARQSAEEAELQRRRDAEFAHQMEAAIALRAQAEKDASRAKFNAAQAKAEAERITLLRRSLMNDALKQREKSKKEVNKMSVGTSTRPAPRKQNKGISVALRPESKHVATATESIQLRHSSAGTESIQVRHSAAGTDSIQVRHSAVGTEQIQCKDSSIATDFFGTRLKDSSTCTEIPKRRNVAISCTPLVTPKVSVHTQVFPPQLWHAATQSSPHSDDFLSYLQADSSPPPRSRRHLQVEEVVSHNQPAFAEEKGEKHYVGREAVVLAQVLGAKIAERRRKRVSLLEETIMTKLKERNEKAVEYYNQVQLLY
uniref:Uncharacterized protein n=1 Tax=Aureoumbra lagunensis TaxID=44058 RepID=A0A7S3JUW5_9STRA